MITDVLVDGDFDDFQVCSTPDLLGWELNKAGVLINLATNCLGCHNVPRKSLVSSSMSTNSSIDFASSQYDLYTKSENVPDIKKLWPYYQNLIDKYIPGILEW